MSQSNPVLEVKELKKSFRIGRKKRVILNGLNFSVNKGEWLSIMGPSGCGKTTLLNILALLDKKFESGHFILDDERITSSLSSTLRAMYRAEKLGIVFQDHYLIPHLTIRENVQLPFLWTQKRYSRDHMDKRARTVIEMVGLSERIDHFPEEISGGEKQRASIARALVRQPKLLLLDEPTGNLDVKTGKAILALFQRIAKRGVTIIMVTHDTEAAKLSDRILILKNGSLQEIKKQ